MSVPVFSQSDAKRARKETLKDAVVVALRGRGGTVTVSADSWLGDKLGFRCSNTELSAAVAELIQQGRLVRARRHPESIGDNDRPVTFRLIGD